MRLTEREAGVKVGACALLRVRGRGAAERSGERRHP